MFDNIHPNLDYRESDREFWDEELDKFVPDKIFDCHIHMFNKEALYHKYRTECQIADADFKLIKKYHELVFPNRSVNSLYLGFPNGPNTLGIIIPVKMAFFSFAQSDSNERPTFLDLPYKLSLSS